MSDQLQSMTDRELKEELRHCEAGTYEPPGVWSSPYSMDALVRAHILASQRGVDQYRQELRRREQFREAYWDVAWGYFRRLPWESRIVVTEAGQKRQQSWRPAYDRHVVTWLNHTDKLIQKWRR